MLVRSVTVLVVSALLAMTGACSGGGAAEPVASVSLTLSKTRVPLGSPIDFTYQFVPADGASIPGDYRVFVQVRSADGQTDLWQDDHDPPVPTSQWKPGQKVEYTRTIFVPVKPYLGEATIEVGLYRENQRLSLKTSEPTPRETTAQSYRVGTLQLLPSSDSLFVIYPSGWHPDEFAEDTPSTTWKWTQKSARFSVRNPRTDVTLFLEYDARPDLFGGVPQQVTLYAGDQAVQTFAADSIKATLLRIPITAAQLGPNDMTDLRLELDKTFVPAKLPAGGRDTRELGIRVYHLVVEGR